MPTNNPSVNSTIKYSECLDIIHHRILSYESTHGIILLGDLNGTLQQPRSYNKHDILLRTFINKLQIHVPDGVNPTFFHHSGSPSSQIDYIRVIAKLPNSEQSNKGKVKTHKYINRQNQSTSYLLMKTP